MDPVSWTQVYDPLGIRSWHSIASGSIFGVIVMLNAYVFPHVVPDGLTCVK
ncbi:MAG: hypothetical protein WA361_20515 [Candidatus Acidiferrales bacterium]